MKSQRSDLVTIAVTRNTRDKIRKCALTNGKKMWAVVDDLVKAR